MTIGLTYDLRNDYLQAGYSQEETAEFDKESTIQGIEEAIQKTGHRTVKIGNVQALIKHLLAGDKWDMVFNIAEGLYGEGRESLIPALLDAHKIPYVFSGPVTLAIALNKAYAKHIVQNNHIKTPHFSVVSNISDIPNIHLSYPLFAKPISEGSGKGIDNYSKVTNIEELNFTCQRLLNTFKQKVLVEEYLPGREFTVGVIGNGNEAYCPGAIEIVYKNQQEGIYSYENKENYTKVVDYIPVKGDLFESCKSIALNVWHSLNCYDAGRIDIKMDAYGTLNFMEINPLAGLNPISSDLPILCQLNEKSYQTLINEILVAAIKRNFGVI